MWSLEMGSEGKKNWAYRVKHVLQDADMGATTSYLIRIVSNDSWHLSTLKRLRLNGVKTESRQEMRQVETN